MGTHVINTASGKQLDLDQPTASQIDLQDIAGGLSRICRFGAQTVSFYSVAQHAVLVSQIVADHGRPDLALLALHHDSHEAFVCDLPAPLKSKFRDSGQTAYDEVCDALDIAIFEALGISPAGEDENSIKAADLEALMVEAAVLLPDGGEGIHDIRDLPLQSPSRLGTSFAPEQARELFMRTHEQLVR